MVETLSNQGLFPYLSPDDEPFKDLNLVSSDGHQLGVNKILFALSSSYLPALTELDNTGKLGDVITEVNKEELAAVVDFVHFGRLPLELGPTRMEAFKSLGMDLLGKKFSKDVKVELPKMVSNVEMEEEEEDMDVEENTKLELLEMEEKEDEDLPESIFDEDDFFELEDIYLQEFEEDEEEEDDDEPKKTNKRAYTITAEVQKLTPTDKVDQKPGVCKICKSTPGHCGKGSRRLVHAHLPAHVEVIHSLKARTCDLCDHEAFETRRLLMKHKNQTHTKVTCGICGKQMASKSLAEHKLAIHGIESKNYLTKTQQLTPADKADQIPGVCEICQSTPGHCHEASRNMVHAHLPAHMEVIHSVKARSCELCDKVFETRKVAINHAKSTAHKPKSCDICGKEVSGQKSLEAHMLAIHGNPEDFPFKCDQCPKGYANKHTLTEHILMNHTESKDYVCKYCGSGHFSQKRLTYHFKMSCTMNENEEEAQGRTEALRRTRKERKSKKDILGDCPGYESRLVIRKLTPDDKAEQKPGVCQLCRKNPGDEGRREYVHTHLPAHMEVIHSLKARTCEDCDKVFDTRKVLLRHVYAVHRRRCTCDICGKVLSCKKRLAVHQMAVHGNPEDRPFKCDQCPKAYIERSGLKEHMAVQHGETKAFICEHCGSSFASQRRLGYHHKNVHSGTRQRQTNNKADYCCDVCGKVLSCPSSLTVHMLSVHGKKEDLPFKCEQCPKGYVNKSKLANHINLMHHSASPYICKYCGSTHLTQQRLTHHVKSCSQNENKDEKCSFTCEHCGSSYSAQRTLEAHLRTVHNVEPPNFYEFRGEARKVRRTRGPDGKLTENTKGSSFVDQFDKLDMETDKDVSCKICKRRFTGNTAYIRACQHVTAKHCSDEEKPFHCKLCGKGFAREAVLTSHMEMHENKKAYHCSYDNCGARFNTAGNRNGHERAVHLGIKKKGVLAKSRPKNMKRQAAPETGEERKQRWLEHLKAEESGAVNNPDIMD